MLFQIKGKFVTADQASLDWMTHRQSRVLAGKFDDLIDRAEKFLGLLRRDFGFRRRWRSFAFIIGLLMGRCSPVIARTVTWTGLC
jgi:hypothetical protein